MPCSNTLIYAMLLPLIFFNPVQAQNKDQQRITSNSIPAAHAGLTKSQPSTMYDDVSCGLRDKAGNLWFGVAGAKLAGMPLGQGVYRYDGNTFTNFTTKDGLNHNTVYCMLEDKVGNIWFGTHAGICCYNGKTFTNVPIVINNGIKLYPDSSSGKKTSVKTEVWSMMQDRSGKLWFGTTAGVYCYNGKSFTGFFDNDSIVNNDKLNFRFICAMIEDRAGNIWFGSGMGEGLCRFDGKNLNSITSKGFARVNTLVEDGEGRIWFGIGFNRAGYYDGKAITKLTGKDGIGNPVLMDKKGRIWFRGSEKENDLENEGGVWCYDGTSLPNGSAGFTNFTSKDGIGIYTVFSIVEDKAGNIWFGTRNTGLYRYDGKTFTIIS